MTTNYEEPISINEAINLIGSNDLLLPAIQRKFVWDQKRICSFFDSILNEYPINSFLSWEVQDSNIKNNYKFYEFLKDYHQKNTTENPLIETDASFKNFKAIMDGQQRLTSLYIGLRGSFSTKTYKKRKNDKNYPKRKLYIPLEPIISDDPNQNTKTNNKDILNYNFTFLSEDEYQWKKKKDENFWFPISKILTIEKIEDINEIKKVINSLVVEYNLENNLFAQKILYKLYKKIRIDKILYFFNEKKQNADLILNSFIRVNTGGINLTYAQLMESIITSHWNGDFKGEQNRLIKDIDEIGFWVNEAFILRVSLMLTEADIKLNVENFTLTQVKEIQKEWESIKECLKETFIFIKKIGINKNSLHSINTIIPICYYFYKKRVENKPLYSTINNLCKNQKERENISRWLYISLIKGNFKSRGLDALLLSLRMLLKESLENKNYFPLEEIIKKYKGTKKDFSFNEEDLEDLMNLEYEEPRCASILYLIFPEKDPTTFFHIDHLHPKSHFLNEKKLKNIDFLKNNEDLLKFYLNKKHWNTLSNLHLLNKELNLSKKDKDPSKMVIRRKSQPEEI